MSAPEISTPERPPKKTEAVQIATPLTRFPSGRVVVIVDSVAGNIRAAPTPLTARLVMTNETSEVRSVAAFATPNIKIPKSSILRRPYRSPKAPAGSKRVARKKA